MRVALSSDEPYRVHEILRELVRARGHVTQLFGSFADGKELLWTKAAEVAAAAVAHGLCDEGILLCWTGTGMAMAANKVRGIRAALCIDAETARGARIWNHANVLVLSNRLLSEDVAKEIVRAWFDTPHDARGQAGVEALTEMDRRITG